MSESFHYERILLFYVGWIFRRTAASNCGMMRSVPASPDAASRVLGRGGRGPPQSQRFLHAVTSSIRAAFFDFMSPHMVFMFTSPVTTLSSSLNRSGVSW